MDSLPFDILDEILFKLDLKSVGMMQYTDRSIKSHITKDQYFKSYLSRTGSKLFHMSTFFSNIIFWHSTDPKSTRNQQLLQLLQHSVIGSCSGLHLHLADGRLCVGDPFTRPQEPRLLDHCGSKFLPDILSPSDKSLRAQNNRIGFAVDQIDKGIFFKIVCINEVKASNPEETMYQFEIGSEDSNWRLSETTITCVSSDLIPVNKPVYFDGYVHWLRNDGSILAFNPGTEQARLIPTKLPQNSKNIINITLAAADNKLTLVMAMEEVNYVYALDNNILTNHHHHHHPKWVLVNRIDNGECIKDWDVAAYDGESLMVREKEEERYNGVVHVFDLTPHKKRFTSQSKIVKIIVGISSLNLMSYFYDKKITGTRKRLILKEEKPSRSPDVLRFKKRIRSLLVNE